ncbi:TetR/AcrR family transcriptional regulator [Gordonia sp. ABSL1-1]|uniref:TetR/AcrR family transcriptional regulator n=1 Tax=Gordonia sp. ABSL1-1 TaxID=3053923 RepID=UPI0025722AF9|nr:TetR/AcrR family transcriptional regulator [Gordonia sp. ABSL1-1]MDL9936466.1 TetR/AcrR family transcriptional regulator [Gordonia sp. ABSL1-1]
MRTHGWGGRPPVTDDEAVARILAATRTTIDARGVSTSLADVARALGVTRQTVYRYFAGTDELLAATALDAVDGLLNRMADRLRGITAPDVAIVDGIAGVLEELAADNYVGLLFRPGHVSLPVVGEITSEMGRQFARSMVDRLDVDWGGEGFGEAELDIVAEIVLRALQSMLLDAGSPPRTGADRRRFLDVWCGAAIRELAGRK